MSRPLVNKHGTTSNIPTKQKNGIIYLNREGFKPDHKGNVVIKFKTDKEGVRKANKLKKLANNPFINMNVKFIKINE